jgi:riboflavin kinase/FMN adenylyltransferase
MRLVRVPEDAPPAIPPEAVVTIGNFDGVHRGHRYLIGKVVRRAGSLGAESAVVTFDPHPRLVVRPELPLQLLSTIDEKLDLLGQLGVDRVLVWRFDQVTQQTTAEQFLAQLARWIRLRCLVHGPGFALGRRRQGTAAVIAEIGRRSGFGVEEIAPLRGQDTQVVPAQRSPADGLPAGGTHSAALVGGMLAGPVSSSEIRALVAQGRVTQAAKALARSPTLTGEVIEGQRVGRTLGFPTANIQIDGPLVVPADGVYAAWAELRPHTPQARRLPAAVSIGFRPTFDGAARVVESHLLDFAGDLYGQRIRLHFVARLRGQERFPDVGALISQMRRDVDTTRALLNTEAQVERDLIAADG